MKFELDIKVSGKVSNGEVGIGLEGCDKVEESLGVKVVSREKLFRLIKLLTGSVRRLVRLWMLLSMRLSLEFLVTAREIRIQLLILIKGTVQEVVVLVWHLMR